MLNRILLALAVAVAAACGGPTETAAREGWTAYSDPHDWYVEYPNDWRIQPYEGTCPEPAWGMLISNAPRDFTHPPEQQGACAVVWDFRGMPDDIVAVHFLHHEGQLDAVRNVFPAASPSPGDFPLSLDDALMSRHEGRPPFGDPQPRRWLEFGFEDAIYDIEVWFGSEASTADKQAAHDIVASIRPE